jgi:hypothetical protein
MTISIVNAEYVGEYRINFNFSDGTRREIDFSNFLKKSKNPMVRKYLDKKRFESYTIIYGDIVWNDYELCFPIWDIHQGSI